MGSFNSHEKRILKWQLFTSIFFLVGEEETYKCLLHVMGISNVKTEANKLSSKAQTSSEKNTCLFRKNV